MPNKTDIDPLSITDGKISNLANINPKKLAKATAGQVLVAQANGRFAAKSLSGDISLQASGAATVTSVVTTEGGGTTTVVTGPQGPSGAQGATGPQGEQGPSGSDATVTTSAVDSAGAVMETDLVQTSAGAGDASKPVKLDATGKIDASMIDGNDVSYNDISNKPASFTPSTHASTHATGGTDAIAPSDIGAATNDHTHDAATTTANGFMASGDKTKLNGIEDNATADQSASEIKTAYESNSDTNAFTDADHTKLDNIPTLGSAAEAATSDFAAAGHNHDDRYYTETETDYLLSGKAESGHNHDGVYSGVSHTHNEANTVSAGFMPASDKLFVDNLSDKVSVQTTGSTAGFIGINDTSPSYQLDVDGTARFTSEVKIGGYKFPVADGTNGQVLVRASGTTNNGVLEWQDQSGGNTYTAGDGLSLSGTEFSYDNSVIASQTDLSSAINPKLDASNNLSDLNNAGTARTNLGLGSAATYASTDFASSGHTHSTGNNGFVPAAGTSGQFLAHDGTFQTPSSSALSKFTTTITFGVGAAGTTVDFTLNIGGGSTTTHNGYIIQHNLGTTKFVASVRTPYDPSGDNSDDATPDTWVDLFDNLYWQHMDVGYAGGNSIDVNAVLIATVNSSKLEDSNYCAIVIPSDADDNPSRMYEVTLIG